MTLKYVPPGGSTPNSDRRLLLQLVIVVERVAAARVGVVARERNLGRGTLLHEQLAGLVEEKDGEGAVQLDVAVVPKVAVPLRRTARDDVSLRDEDALLLERGSLGLVDARLVHRGSRQGAERGGKLLQPPRERQQTAARRDEHGYTHPSFCSPCAARCDGKKHDNTRLYSRDAFNIEPEQQARRQRHAFFSRHPPHKRKLLCSTAHSNRMAHRERRACIWPVLSHS